MAGSIRQLPSGAWHLRVSAGTDRITGKRRVITETVTGSRRTAELRLAELVSKAQRGHGSGALSVNDVLDAYLELPRLARATRAKWSAARAHLPAGIGRMRASKLTGRDLDDVYRRLGAAGVGAATVRSLHGLLGAAYGQALKWGTVDDNPIGRATPPPAGKSRADGDVTDAQIAALFELVAGDVQRTLWLRLACTTAARSAELCALRWSSVLPDGRLAVRAAIERDRARSVKDPKTKRPRYIALDDDTVQMIRARQHEQRIRALEMGVPLDSDPYLLSHDDASATPWRPDSATQAFIRLRNRAGLGGVRLHDLRHAAASYMLANGMDAAAVANRLGHSTPRTTLQVYAHVLQGRDTVAAEMMARRLAKG